MLKSYHSNCNNHKMSLHKSLRLGSSNSNRSVFTRRERLDILIDGDEFAEGDNPLGLRKVRTQFKSVSKKQLKAAEKERREAVKAEAAEELAAQRAADAEFV